MNCENNPNFEGMREDSLSIVTSTMFKLKVPGEYSEKYHYSRYGNPTRDILENALAAMDDAKYAIAYCSRTAAQMAAFSILKPGDLVVFSDILNCQKFQKLYPMFLMVTINCDDMKIFEQSFPANAKMIFIESSNLFQTPLDIQSIADFVHTKSKAIFVVDNTFQTSHLQKPLNFGADIVCYSLNEYIGGHDDVNLGSVSTNDKNWFEKLRYYQISSGTVPSPIDCFMITRSLKTFDIRMERCLKSSEEIGKFLDEHEKVESVFKSFLNGKSCEYSGVLSFKLKEGFISFETFSSLLKFIKTSETSGGTNTSISHPWSMSHADLPKQSRLDIGITESFMKLSIGLEQSTEIINDLKQALDQVS